MSRPPRRVNPTDSRDFLDDRGVRWRVREIDASRLPNARAPFALVFECDRGWRLCWQYPADWVRLPDAELEALSFTC